MAMLADRHTRLALGKTQFPKANSRWFCWRFQPSFNHTFVRYAAQQSAWNHTLYFAFEVVSYYCAPPARSTGERREGQAPGAAPTAAPRYRPYPWVKFHPNLQCRDFDASLHLKYSKKINTYYCTVVLSTSAHTTHLTQISSTRGAPIIYTWRHYTYVLRGKAALLRTTLSPAVSGCANTQPSVGPNHCAGLLAAVIIQHLQSIVQIPYEEEWTHLQRGDMRACSRITVSKPTSHERLHWTMQLPDGKRGAPPA